MGDCFVSGTAKTSRHRKYNKFPVRVYYADTDTAGVVYYANYLRFAECGRTELLRELGIEHRKLLRDDNLLFVVKSVKIEYQASAKLDDLLEVRTWVSSIGGASFEMKQDICRDGDVLASAAVGIVTVTPKGRVIRMPDHLRKALESCKS